MPQHLALYRSTIIPKMDTELVHKIFARDEAESAPPCFTGNEYDGRMGLRISSIFVILVGSIFGAVFPVVARRFGGSGIPSWTFFVAKYFGSGVIIATAFIHLLGPAEEALRNSCLTGAITEYSWVEGIILMTIVVMFFVELMVMRYARFGQNDQRDVENHIHSHLDDDEDATTDERNRVVPRYDNLDRPWRHQDTEMSEKTGMEGYMAQLTSIFILEFVHNLYIVIVFHQTFEGLGLGSRLATLPWPQSKLLTPYILGLVYGVSTPIAIAIGLGVRKTYPPTGRTTLIVNGVFDSISGGILIYVGLVELMAHEFMFTPSMRRAPIQTVLAALLLLSSGAALMALLGKWA
ncbi:Zinc/iron permease [Penicillium roqueforti FM164]|uniref:Zinc/iron permease n=1 Tax=Penicillium roqueforti (strain FM164) TaxID=1365484 RepID=W6QKG8_PENRF|nr:Zinc/iron permease [Penicillium roqueforti FM164]